MPKSCFWAINRSGQLFYFTLDELKWKTEKPNVSKQAFKKIAAQEHCAWGIGADQRLYMCIFKTDIPIRVQVSTYENQRWSPMQGWSEKSLFRTDRYAWSSEDGSVNAPRESFEIESHWKWENEWYKDESIQCDIEAWQYAIDFPRTYYKQKGKSSFVRRRKWSRYKCFKDFGKWILIHWEEGRKDPFQDITIGGSWLPRQAPGYLAVWALTFSGKVLYRDGISQNCPEGKQWIRLDGCEDLNLVQISVGPSGLLWAIRWDGRAVVRDGISHQNPLGKRWIDVESPEIGSNTMEFQHVSVGMNAVWALMQNQKVFYRKGIDGAQAHTDDKFACGSRWVEMVGDFKLMSVGPNDQVWAIDKVGSVVIRTDITQNEPVGKKWKVLKSAPGLSEVDVRSPSEGLSHWIWINSGGCNVDAKFFKNIESTLQSARSSCSSLNSVKTRISREPWRLKILEGLKERNEKEIDRYQSFCLGTQTDGESQWFKTTKCRLLTDPLINLWYECHLKLQSNEGDGIAILIYYSNHDQFREIRVPLKEVSAVNLTKIPSQPNTFMINTLERTFRRNPLIISMESEKELNEWITLISVETAKVRLSHSVRKPTKNTVWVTSATGDIFYCTQTTFEGFALDKMFWLQMGGHMKKVTAGVDGVVWGIGYDGKAYAYSGGEGGGIFSGHDFSQDFIYEQEDTDYVYIYQNQRWNPIQGFSDKLLPSDRWAWSDESGIYHCPKDGYRLPSSQWKWDGEWSFVFKEGETDEDGWQYAVDFPRRYHSHRGMNDFVRRRKWKRKCNLKTTGPWTLVESDLRLADVAIQTDPGDTVAYCVAVWAVSTNGDVYYRDSVHAMKPTGFSWRRITANDKFISISIGSNKKVWGIAQDGSAYLRAGFGSDAQLGNQWFRCSADKKLSLRHISVGADAVLALDNAGTLWSRDGVTRTFPEGTGWTSISPGFSHVSLGYRNDTWIVRNNDVEICVGKDVTNLLETNMPKVICVLSGGWNTVCVRGCSPEVVEADECLDVTEGTSNEILENTSELITTTENKLNEEISIFDLYRKPDDSDDDFFSDELESADELAEEEP